MGLWESPIVGFDCFGWEIEDTGGGQSGLVNPRQLAGVLPVVATHKACLHGGHLGSVNPYTLALSSTLLAGLQQPFPAGFAIGSEFA